MLWMSAAPSLGSMMHASCEQQAPRAVRCHPRHPASAAARVGGCHFQSQPQRSEVWAGAYRRWRRAHSRFVVPWSGTRLAALPEEPAAPAAQSTHSVRDQLLPQQACIQIHNPCSTERAQRQGPCAAPEGMYVCPRPSGSASQSSRSCGRCLMGSRSSLASNDRRLKEVQGLVQLVGPALWLLRADGLLVKQVMHLALSA